MNDPVQGQTSATTLLSFEDQSIFTLLGLEYLPDTEKDRFIGVLVRQSIQMSLEDIFDDPTVDQNKKDQVYSLTDHETDSEKMQLKLIELFPDIPGRINDNAQKLKMEMCLKQIDDMIKALQGKFSGEILVKLETLYKDAEMFYQKSDTVNFLRIWQEYNSLIKNGTIWRSS